VIEYRVNPEERKRDKEGLYDCKKWGKRKKPSIKKGISGKKKDVSEWED